MSMRYSDEDLEKLLNDLESGLVERKEAWRGDAPDSGRQAVCAFANDLPDHRKPESRRCYEGHGIRAEIRHWDSNRKGGNEEKRQPGYRISR